ncbi:MAG: 2-keto-4-pentenoate hydratase [Acidimicrobiaceae bacterium]|nr:2-keto-4-pentenoate hydratase [Acidimicrobiaceae bacterium]
MDQDTRTEASRALLDALRARQPIQPLSESYPGINIDDAYEIQLIGVRTEIESGRVVRGHKVGLTSQAMQTMLGVHEPDYGHLFDNMFFPEGSSVSIELFLQPRVEIEVAFVLGERLAGPGVTVADVLRATDFVCPSIEIIDSRIVDWKITLADTIADNGSSAGVVLGGRRTRLDGLDLRTIGTVLRRNGSIVETGASGAVLGNPANAVAWLANKVAAFGVALEPGHVILPGACTRAVDVEGGDVFRADFDGLGHVSIAFPREATE